MTVRGRQQFLSACVSIRLLREKHRSELPIELFYGGDDDLPVEAIKYLSSSFANTAVIDVFELARLKPLPADLDLNGDQLKAIAVLYSSFQEVLWLDVFTVLARDPAYLFQSESYSRHGVLLWPDYCNMHSAVAEAFDLFGVPLPKEYPAFPFGELSRWSEDCWGSSQEMHGGQYLIDKARAWEAINVAAFVSANHHYFFKHVFASEKQALLLSLQMTKNSFVMASTRPTGLGIKAKLDGKSSVFVNTVVHRDPETDKAVFLHRTHAKFYLDTVSGRMPQAWRHSVVQQPRGTWSLHVRGGHVPNKVFIGKSGEVALVYQAADVTAQPQKISSDVWSSECCLCAWLSW
jgi:hypothetical protein